MLAILSPGWAYLLGLAIGAIISGVAIGGTLIAFALIAFFRELKRQIEGR